MISRVLLRKLQAMQPSRDYEAFGDDDEFEPIRDGQPQDSDSDMDMGFSSDVMGSGSSTVKRGTKRPAPVPITSGPASVEEAHPGSDNKRAKGKGKGGKPKANGKPQRPDPAGPALRSVASNVHVDKAKAALAKHQETFAEDKLWSAKIRSRAIETMDKNLTGLSVPLSSSEIPEVEKLCRDMVLFAEETATKHKLFGDVRQSPLAQVTGMSDEAHLVFRKLEPSTVSHIMTWLAGVILKDIDLEKSTDPDLSRATDLFFKLLNASPSQGLSLNHYIHATAHQYGIGELEQVAEGPIRSLQLQLYNMWLDKICRAKSFPKFSRGILAWLGAETCHDLT